MAALTARQARVQAYADRHGLTVEIRTETFGDTEITFLTVTNPGRPYSGHVGLSAWVRPTTGRTSHNATAGTFDSKTIRLRDVFIRLGMLHD
jgi:hypothetical protein